VLLVFILAVTIGAMWETKRDRRPRAMPLLAMCVFVAGALFSLSRLV
jgi:hypothetical protein